MTMLIRWEKENENEKEKNMEMNGNKRDVIPRRAIKKMSCYG